MLMSNGVIDTTNDTCNPDIQHGQSSFNNVGPDAINHQLDADNMHFQPIQILDGIMANETICKNPMDMIGFEGLATANENTISAQRPSPSPTLLLPSPPPPLPQQQQQSHQHSPILVQSSDNVSNHHIHGSATDAIASNENQFLHMHQLRQSRSMSFADESSILRRRQLSRVAEWVQNNSNHRTCIIDSSASTCGDTQPIDGNVSWSQRSHFSTKIL